MSRPRPLTAAHVEVRGRGGQRAGAQRVCVRFRPRPLRTTHVEFPVRGGCGQRGGVEQRVYVRSRSWPLIATHVEVPVRGRGGQRGGAQRVARPRGPVHRYTHMTTVQYNTQTQEAGIHRCGWLFITGNFKNNKMFGQREKIIKTQRF